MKKVTWLRTLVTVVLSVTVVSMVYVFTKGWPLMRPPRMEDIKEVTMTDTESGVKKEFVDEENKELAVKLINFLNYVPFSTASDTYGPLIIITYVLDDGTEIKISANNTEVFFNGNGHQLKDAEIFGNLTKAVFFSEETARESAQ